MVTFPTVQWIQQNPAINPSGSRHLLNLGFIKQLGTGAGQELNFGQVNTTGSGNITGTLLCYARASSFGNASGIFNMRVFLVNTSAWGAGTYRFLEQKHLHFIPNLQLSSSANNTPTTIPPAANFSGTITAPEYPLGKPWISGIIDNDASQYLYVAVEAGADVPVGTYGGAGTGTFRYRLLYDFS